MSRLMAVGMIMQTKHNLSQANHFVFYFENMINVALFHSKNLTPYSGTTEVFIFTADSK